jgi:hypothetical protein
VYRGLVISAMIAAGSLQGAWRSSPAALRAIALPHTYAASAPNDEININIAQLAGRAALRRPAQAQLSREEVLSILLLMAQRPQGARS